MIVNSLQSRPQVGLDVESNTTESSCFMFCGEVRSTLA